MQIKWLLQLSMLAAIAVCLSKLNLHFLSSHVSCITNNTICFYLYIIASLTNHVMTSEKLRLFTFEIIDHLSCCSLQLSSTLPHNVFKSFRRSQQVVYLILQSGVCNLQSQIVYQISCEIWLCNERYVNDNINNCRQFHKTSVGKQFLYNFLLSIFSSPSRDKAMLFLVPISKFKPSFLSPIMMFVYYCLQKKNTLSWATYHPSFSSLFMVFPNQLFLYPLVL